MEPFIITSNYTPFFFPCICRLKINYDITEECIEKYTEKVQDFLNAMSEQLSVPALMTPSLAAQYQTENYHPKRPVLGHMRNIVTSPYFTWDCIGLSMLFSATAADICRYNDTAGEWLVYDGRVWQSDKHSVEVLRYSMELARILQSKVEEITADMDDERAEYVRKLILNKLPERALRKNIVLDARAELKVYSENLDRDHNLLNVANGTLNLNTFTLLRHDPKDLITRFSPVVYDPSATFPRFDRFIDEITCGNEDLKTYIQKVLGLTLSGDISQECMWIFHGKNTRNGKTTLLEAVRHVLGGVHGYGVSVNPATFAAKKFQDGSKPSGDIARIDRSRLAVVTEPNKRMEIDEALLKALTGRDTIVARFMFKDDQEFVPTCKIIFGTNHLPLINDLSLFQSYRIIVVPFYRHFSEEEMDPNLKDQLLTPEASSAILNWMIEGLKKARKYGLKRPSCVESETQDYFCSSDWFSQFVAECLVPVNQNTKAKDVYVIYQQWAKENAIRLIGKSEFYDELRSHGMMLDLGTVGGVTVKNVIPGYGIVFGEYEYSE